jgi:serine/threonine protein phosphatase PrpC
LNFIRLLRRKSSEPASRWPEPPAADLAAPAGVRSVARSHVGVVRALNEDRFLDLPEQGLWAVADGMGGHRAGDMAAQMVVDAIAEIAAETSVEGIRSAVQAANARLVNHSASSRQDVSGSTLVVLTIEGSRYDCLWAGDSQAWLRRGGGWRQITRDHSLVEDLLQAGAIEADQRHLHPHRHVITRAVGVAETLELDHVQGSLADGDVILLCSDGLTNVVDPAALAIPAGTPDLDAMADALLSQALAGGAADNVTFILVLFRDFTNRKSSRT